ncbi:MAG TPA: YdcF family protein [Rhodocyclaceae bacterium]|nr:YdcF family protein [Rhodocyclaceae bacterium]HNI82813.1 YdcF family protein [Rhodocyclaceae bacterium]
MFFLKKIAAALLLPPFLPFLLIIAGLLLLHRQPRTGRLLAWCGVVTGIALSLPASVGLLVTPLERDAALDVRDLPAAEAIVILGGGTRHYAPDFGGQTVNRLTLERLRYGALLARHSRLPVLVSGGSPTPGIAEGILMRRVMEEEFRVSVRWVESQSLDTAENAAFSVPVLRAAGVRRVLLVTHAAHMRRALEAFEAAGMHAIPAPTAFFHGAGPADEVVDFLPGMNAAFAGDYAAHEWLGLAARRLTDLGGGLIRR